MTSRCYRGARLAVPGRVLRLVLASIPLSLAAGCVMPYALPPLRGELGGATRSGDGAAFHVGGGAHLASGTTKPDQRFDVGVGGFYDAREHGSTKGAYGEVSYFLERHSITRTSIGLRGELRWDPEGRGTGAKLRVEHELFGSTDKGYSGSDRCGVIAGGALGTGAIGVFAEAGPVVMPGDRTAWMAAAGVTFRTPGTVGVAVGIPGCK